MAEEQVEPIKYVIYKTETCAYCPMVAKIFKQWGRTYRFYDITNDVEKARELYDLTGAVTVPITVNEKTGKWAVGFNIEKLKAL